MSLFSEIQSDILGATPVSNILRKAKVLAYRLKNQEFKDWVEYELNGYYGSKDISVPTYRKYKSSSFGDFMNMAWHANNVPIPLNNFPDELREMISLIEMRQGVKELEAMIEAATASETEVFTYPWPAEVLPHLNNRVYQINNRVYQNMNCINAWCVITREHIAQILDTTRNRLLSFILELSDRYPNEANSDFDKGVSIPNDQIRQVFNYFIMGNNPQVVSSANAVSQGGTMSIFDQRNQTVGYQYNAAGDINFDAVKSRVDLTAELIKLKRELAKAIKAKVLDDETATDVEYKLTKAIQQSQKPSPDKKSMLENLNGAKALLSSVSSAVGLVTAFIKAAELVQRFF
jgi:hypothetical protein